MKKTVAKNVIIIIIQMDNQLQTVLDTSSICIVFTSHKYFL